MYLYIDISICIYVYTFMCIYIYIHVYIWNIGLYVRAIAAIASPHDKAQSLKKARSRGYKARTPYLL